MERDSVGWELIYLKTKIQGEKQIKKSKEDISRYSAPMYSSINIWLNYGVHTTNTF